MGSNTDSTKEPLCWFCSRFLIDVGEPYYSNLTPGRTGGGVECSADRWVIARDGDTRDAPAAVADDAVLVIDRASFHRAIRMADTCELYEEVDPDAP